MLTRPDLTPTQRMAVERSRAFRNRIDALAQKLKVGLEAPVPKEVIQPEPEPVQIPAPAPTPWFSILHEIEPTPRQHPSVVTIQNAVSAHYNIRRQDIVSQRRTANVVLPRQIAMYLCRELTPFSLPIIGRRFGGRDHTTALHAYQKISKLVASDAALAGTINSIKESLA